MYNTFNNKRRRGAFHGFRNVKTFDPSKIINSPSQNQPVEKQVVSHAFADFQISDRLKENISRKGYRIPTPIQDQAIPLILEDRDLIGIANTGTGKTAAFLIPLIDKVFKNRNREVLIVTPTRELATQISDELYDFSRNLGIAHALCIGGTNIKRQISDLRRNPNFVIGTPGRILDLLRTRALDLSYFSIVVLDETDRMVDIGFIKDIKYIISLLPNARQSLFFSATVSQEVSGILREFVRNPITLSVKTKETAQNITQSTIKIAH